MTDSLTGLGAHTHFHLRLQEMISEGELFSLFVLDLDAFKTYNEDFGYEAGDELLALVAQLLSRHAAKAKGIVYRLGGDEFASLLPAVEKEEALDLAESIRLEIEERLRHHQGRVVTASIGLAAFPSDAIEKKDLLKATDDALYVAKRGGRNLVCPSKTLQERTAKPIVEDPPDDWAHPQPAPLKPLPKGTSGMAELPRDP